MVSCVLLSTVLSKVVAGGTQAKGAFIISPKYEEITKMIDLELDRGFTFINSEGGYSNEEQHLIYLVINTKEIPLLKQIVRNEDPNAFMTIFDATEAIGEGFSYKAKKTSLFSHK